VQDADAVRQLFGLGQVVRTKQDGRVVDAPDLADEILHLELGARIEPRCRLVEQQQDGRGEKRPREGHLLLHAAG
jgi:hypothetical protein